MAILTSSQLTFVDITDQRQLSAYLTSNLTTVQIYDSNTATYSPNWSSTNLVITPQVFLDQQSVELTDTNLTISWTRKDGNATATALVAGETVTNKVLTVNKNNLDDSTSNMLTYICQASYADSETGQTINITTQLNYTLIRTASDAKVCTISGPQVFKYNTSGTLVGDQQIALTGTVSGNISISKWQYYNSGTSSYTDYPATADNANITGATLIVKPTHAIFNSSGVANIKLLTSDNGIYDILTITKIYDGGRGADGSPGSAGANAYTIVLSNESHIFPGNVTYAVQNSTASTTIKAYQGSIAQNVTITQVGTKASNLITAQDCGTCPGIYFKVTGNGTGATSIEFTINSATLSTANGSIPIMLTVGGMNFTKYFSWSVAYTGSGACSLNITSSSQIFKSSDGTTFTPNNITLTPVVQNLELSSCIWSYSINGGVSFSAVNTSMINDTTKVLTIPKTWDAFTAIVTSVVLKCTSGDYYDTMTVSKLSDGQSATAAYTVILSNEVQTIATNTARKPLANTSYNCNIIVYEGNNQLAATSSATVGEGYFKVTLPSNPDGITLSQSTPGVVVFSVNTSTAIAASGNIDLSIDIEGQSSVTKSISYAVAQTGSNGTNAVVFTVYAPNGTVFSNQSGSLLLSTTAYNGSTAISTGATYQWAKYIAGSWTNVSGATNSSLTVNGSDVTNIASYKCTMTYGGKTYVDVITLEDKSDVYVSEMLTVGGTTFKNGQGGSFVYIKVRTNGREVDPLKGVLSTSTLASGAGNSGEYYYYLNTASGAIQLYKHNGSTWATSSDAQSLTYTWYLMDKDGNHDTFNGGASSKTGKIIYLSCADIDSIGTLQCDISNT